MGKGLTFIRHIAHGTRAPRTLATKKHRVHFGRLFQSPRAHDICMSDTVGRSARLMWINNCLLPIAPAFQDVLHCFASALAFCVLPAVSPEVCCVAGPTAVGRRLLATFQQCSLWLCSIRFERRFIHVIAGRTAHFCVFHLVRKSRGRHRLCARTAPQQRLLGVATVSRKSLYI